MYMVNIEIECTLIALSYFEARGGYKKEKNVCEYVVWGRGAQEVIFKAENIETNVNTFLTFW